MSRIMLVCSFAALIGAGSTQGASAVESANQTAWARARLACADVGIAPGSGAFGQVSSISTTPCGTSRTPVNADGQDR